MVIFWFLRHSKVIEKIIKILIYYSKIKKIKYKFKEKIVYKKMRKILFNKMLIMWKKGKMNNINNNNNKYNDNNND